MRVIKPLEKFEQIQSNNGKLNSTADAGQNQLNNTEGSAQCKVQ